MAVTSGFWPRVRAHALRAPVFLGSLPHQTGRCASPPAHRSFAASYSALKNLGRPRQGLFSFHWTTEAMRSPAPRPAPSGNILGSKVYTSATIRTNFFGFSFLQLLDLFLSLFSFFSYLLFNFFLFFSSYLFLFFSQGYNSSSYSSPLIFSTVCRITDMHINYICTHIRHSEGFLEGAKLFLSSYSSLLYTIFFLFLFFSSYNLTVCCITTKLMTCRENPAKIPVWEKIRKSIQLLIQFNRATEGGTVNLHVSLVRLN